MSGNLEKGPQCIPAPYLEPTGTRHICYATPAVRDIFKQAAILHGERSIPVMIEGETGTGKEVVARYIHYGAGKVTTPFVGLNCAALHENSEAELFGFVTGALGGSPPGKRGKLDLAQGGTLFLDLVDQLSLEAQASLLRVIEDQGFYRVGGVRKVDLDIRLICAANVSLEAQVEKGAFRSDLFYRLRGAHLRLPPLRQQKESIVPLARLFLSAAAAKKGKRFKGISKAAANLLLAYDWPGNVRELRHIIEVAVLLWTGTLLRPEHLGQLHPLRPGVGEPQRSIIDIEEFTLPPDGLPLHEFQNRVVLQALRMHNGNKTRTAKYLGISRRSLDSRLKHLL